MTVSVNVRELAKRSKSLAESAPFGHWWNSADAELLFEISEYLWAVAQAAPAALEPAEFTPSSAILSFGA